MFTARFFPYFLNITAGVIWGATFSLTIIATADGAHPVAITAWQVAITLLIFLVASLVARKSPLKRNNFRHYLVLALVGIFTPNLLYYYAAIHLSAGILSITIATVPLFTYAIMLVLRFEPLNTKRVFGIGFGLIAILLLVLPDQGLKSSDASFWTLLVVISAILYSIENVYIGKGVPRDVDIRELLVGSNLIALVLLFPLTMIMGIAEPVSWLATDAGLAVVAMAFVSGIAYAMYFYVVRIAGSVFASQVAYIITISGVVWGIMLLSEQHTVWVWASVIVMMFGLVLVTPDRESGSNTY